MKPNTCIKVSGTRNNLVYEHPERGKARYIRIDDEMVDVIIKHTPPMTRRKQRKALSNIVSTHIPEHPEEYRMDFLVRAESKKQMRAIIVIIKKETLNQIREIHPWLPIINPRSINLLNNQNEQANPPPPSFRHELFRPAKPRPINRILAISFILLLVSGGLNIWAKYTRSESRQQIENASTALSKEEKEKILSLEESIEQLEDELDILVATKPRKIDQMLKSIIDVSEGRLEIQHIIINKRYFKIRGLSDNPLLIALSLNKSPVFRDTSISDIRPDKNRARKTFSLEGLYIGY